MSVGGVKHLSLRNHERLHQWSGAVHINLNGYRPPMHRLILCKHSLIIMQNSSMLISFSPPPSACLCLSSSSPVRLTLVLQFADPSDSAFKSSTCPMPTPLRPWLHSLLLHYIITHHMHTIPDTSGLQYTCEMFAPPSLLSSPAPTISQSADWSHSPPAGSLPRG